jgi:thiol-disulfide isomerase/thioredoxin
MRERGAARSVDYERHVMRTHDEERACRNHRCRPTRRGFIAAMCALLVPLDAAALTETSPLPAAFDPARDPARDLETALHMARSARRRVLAEVGGEWCTWCHIMDRFFAANPDLRKVRDENFVVLKVNFSKENPNQAFLVRWPKVAGYPHLFVLDADGRLLHSQDTSALEAAKDYDPVAFRAFLLKWSPR